MPKSPKAKALAEIRAKALAQMKSAYYFQLISSYFDPKEDPFLGEIRNGNRFWKWYLLFIYLFIGEFRVRISIYISIAILVFGSFSLGLFYYFIEN